MQRIQTLICTILLGSAALQVHAASADSAHRPNCGLQQPPIDAGENGIHGVILKVYPRQRDIGAEYGGCQLTWAQHGNAWVVFFVLHFERGQIIRQTSRSESNPLLAIECSYVQGTLAEHQPTECAQSAAPMPSMQAGCLTLDPAQRKLRALDCSGDDDSPPGDAR